jgi:hypothetical protein
MSPGPACTATPGGGIGTSGGTNTGGGGGGAETIASTNTPGGAGGSGIVVVRGPSAVAFSGGPCAATTFSTHPGGDKIAKFVDSGTLTVALA